MNNKLQAIKNRLNNATEGKWVPENRNTTIFFRMEDCEYCGILEIFMDGYTNEKEDAEFIKHAKDDVAFLLNSIHILQQDIEVLCKTIEHEIKYGNLEGLKKEYDELIKQGLGQL
jgi:hypothetical protein